MATKSDENPPTLFNHLKNWMFVLEKMQEHKYYLYFKCMLVSLTFFCVKFIYSYKDNKALNGGKPCILFEFLAFPGYFTDEKQTLIVSSH